MGLVPFSISQHLLRVLKAVPKRTYIVAGVALAALPAGVSLAMQDSAQPVEPHMTIISDPSQSPSHEKEAASVIQPASNASDNQSQSGTSTNTHSTQVTVNGQDIPVPESGNVNETVVNEDGTTTHVSVNSSTSASNSTTSRSSTNVNIRSSNTTKTRSNTDIKSKN